MDITFIADTHGLHEALHLTGGTVLIHAGDITEYGAEEEVLDFINWFSKQPFIYKIFIAGNHDLFLEECSLLKINRFIPNGIVYLQNSSIEIKGLKIWGSPVTPYFLGMAFNIRSGKDIKKVWDKIPMNTDVLITHGPPKGILDNGIGCEELWSRVNKIRPTVHCFGHAHGQNGLIENNEVTYINASLADCLDPLNNDEYKLMGKPITLLI